MLFAVALSAVRVDSEGVTQVVHTAFTLDAADEDEARGVGLRCVEYLYPGCWSRNVNVSSYRLDPSAPIEDQLPKPMVGLPHGR